jgi:integrase/recombinase XerD
MKHHGTGQAKVLTDLELDKLFQWGFTNNRDRCLYSICLYTGCRISEALTLEITDLTDSYITFRRENTKGKKKARQIPINKQLGEALSRYIDENNPQSFLFPAYPNAKNQEHLHRWTADRVLKQACERIGVKGVSTHSFRRTALTKMHNAGIPLAVIQKISGHSSLQALQKYLEVSDEAVLAAVNFLGSKPAKTVKPPTQRTDQPSGQFL